QAVLGDNAVVQHQSPSLETILQRLEEHDKSIAGSLVSYTCMRRYALENRRFHKSAELQVRMTYTAPGHKSFEVLSEKGASILRHRVLQPMLAAEQEASRDEIRPQTKILPVNYDFKLLGTEMHEGRPAYLLQVTPRTRNKFLIRGRVLIDAANFG